MNRRLDLIDLASTPDGKHDYVGHLRELCEQLEVEHATYFSTNPISGTMHGFTTYPDEWKAHYVQHGLQAFDPTLLSAMRSVAPLDWSRLEQDQNYRRVFSDARDFALPDKGVTVPIRGPYGDIGLLCVCTTTSDKKWQSLKRHNMGMLLTNTVHLHDTVMNSEPLMKALRQPRLSSREIEILQWIAAGKSQRDVGDILSISPRTVEVHLRSSREKLCALNTPQMIGRAVSLGIVQPG